MRFITSFLLTSLLHASCAKGLEAQVATGVQPGDRIRVTLAEGMPFRDPGMGAVEGAGGAEDRVLVGTLASTHDDLLVLTRAGDSGTWDIPFSSLEKLELNTGQNRTFGRTIPISMGVLGAAGGILLAATVDPCSDCFLQIGPSSRPEAFVLGAAIGAIVGIPIGGLWGLQKKDVWEEVAVGGALGRPSPFLSVRSGGGLFVGAVIPVGRWGASGPGAPRGGRADPLLPCVDPETLEPALREVHPLP
jgi:hypothetical protein